MGNKCRNAAEEVIEEALEIDYAQIFQEFTPVLSSQIYDRISRDFFSSTLKFQEDKIIITIHDDRINWNLFKNIVIENQTTGEALLLQSNNITHI